MWKPIEILFLESIKHIEKHYGSEKYKVDEDIEKSKREVNEDVEKLLKRKTGKILTREKVSFFLNYLGKKNTFLDMCFT